MNKILNSSFLIASIALSAQAISTQGTLAATVISNIGIPAPADGSTAPLAGGTTTISMGAAGQDKAFGFTVPSGNDWMFESATFWLVGYDGDAASPPEQPLVTITLDGPNDGTNPVIGTLLPNITDPINNPPGNNDPHYFEFTGDTPTLSAGETYFVTLENDSPSPFNWARAVSGGDEPISNPFTSAGYFFRAADSTGLYTPSNELSGIAINATEILEPLSTPEPSALLGLGVFLGLGALTRKKPMVSK